MSPHARETRPFASEVKFLVDADAGERIRDWARLHMEADPHGTGTFGDEYRTTSLYFDTGQWDVFHRRGSFGRSKYRIRRYGDASSVFLERKLRKPGILVKRRTTVGLDALDRLVTPEPDAEWPGDWFRRRLQLRRINPVCLVSYARMARSAMTPDGAARLTLDEDVRVLGQAGFEVAPWRHDRRISRERTHGGNGSGVLPVLAAADAGQAVLEGQVILELKYRHNLPALFKRLVEEFALAPQSASKYRLGITALEAIRPSMAAVLPAGDAAPHV
ncbi:MAG: polyphosphate polymerase domain-containing protein [Acidobacteriota bacterium]